MKQGAGAAPFFFVAMSATLNLRESAKAAANSVPSPLAASRRFRYFSLQISWVGTTREHRHTRD
jgi:hypothetical protein